MAAAPLSTEGLLANQDEAISFSLEKFLPMSPDSADGAVNPTSTTADECGNKGAMATKQPHVTTPEFQGLAVALPSPTDVNLHFPMSMGMAGTASGAPETSCT